MVDILFQLRKNSKLHQLAETKIQWTLTLESRNLIPKSKGMVKQGILMKKKEGKREFEMVGKKMNKKCKV